MPARTDTEKLAKIKEYCELLVKISADPIPADMTLREGEHWEAVSMGYTTAATTILNYIEHGTGRAPKPKDS